MKIRVVGAAGGEVTGSAFFVQTKPANVLVDCGIFQGGRAAEAKNRGGAAPPPPPRAGPGGRAGGPPPPPPPTPRLAGST